MTAAALPARRSTGALFYLIASQLAGLASLLPWIVVMTVMDAEANASLPLTLFTAAVVGYPLLPLGCAAMAWLRWRRGRTLSALLWTSAPLVVALPVIAFLMSAGGGGIEIVG
ncbi:MAG TPA: hypothetical protein VF665_24790 [Longimicrobium sp.]|jgi:hypothetical protein|uniref:hypothetical protein n=1 Tax=Longimicrobium sp. TaxID=2029185 RepID=UPI002ED9F345